MQAIAIRYYIPYYDFLKSVHEHLYGHEEIDSKNIKIAVLLVQSAENNINTAKTQQPKPNSHEGDSHSLLHTLLRLP